MTDPYAKLIEQFLYQGAPTDDADKDVRFEAVAATVFGTKQRRFGPMPKPEVQVQVRDVIRKSGTRLTFHVPWGSRKQADGMHMDVLEFMAIKQLRCLADELRRFGVASTFVFRVEDLTDLFLFGKDSFEQQQRYMNDLKNLMRLLLDTRVRVVFESECTSWTNFNEAATRYAPTFYKYLQGQLDHEDLKKIGWEGTLPEEQREYYRSAYATYWKPGEREPEWEMARYFAATLARVQQRATGTPIEDYVQICFTHPVPGNPISRPRLYYRSIPERYTNIHRSPWNAKGYFLIGEDNTVKPKSAGVLETLAYNSHELTYSGVRIQTDYVLA